MNPANPAFYDDPAFNYQRYWQHRDYEDQAERLVLKKIFRLAGPQKILVDIGGGFGRLVPDYAGLVQKCILVDPSTKLLSAAKTLCRQHPNLTIEKGQAEKLPLKDQSAGMVLLIRTIHHLANPQKAFAEIYRVLRPHGYLVLEFANELHAKNWLRAFWRRDFGFFTKHTPADLSRKRGAPPFVNYHPNQIRTLLFSEGFEIIKTFSVSNFRHPWLKRIIPQNFLLLLEKQLQEPLASLNFGPSIFLLARKSER